MKTIKQEFKMIPVQTKSLDHIRCDSRGNVLSVNDKNQFFFNGKLVYKGRYLYFDLHNGNYAISRKEDKDEVIYLNGKRAYTLKRENRIFKQEVLNRVQMENIPFYWQLINDKLITNENEHLYIDGVLLLRKDQFDDYRIIGDKLFVEKKEELEVYEVNLSDGNLIEVQSRNLGLIREDGQGKFLFCFPNQFFRNGKLVFHLERYLRDLGKEGSLSSFDWHEGVFAFEVETKIKGTINRTVYVDSKPIYEVSDGYWVTWHLVSGKLLHLEHGAIHYDGKVLFKHEELDEWKVINHHLFIRKGKKFYQVLLPE